VDLMTDTTLSPVEQLRAALLDTAGLDSIPEPEPLVFGMLYRDSLVWLQGRSGEGKSLTALDIAGCVATGQPWQGHRVRRGPVLYLAAEGATGIRWRVRAWEKSMGIDMTDVHFLPLVVPVNNGKQWTGLVELCQQIRAAMVVIDTQARVTVGLEENSAKDMGMVVERFERLRQATAATVVVVHHQGRNGDHMRGSSALDGAASTVIQVSKDDDQVTLKCLKQKDAAEFDDIRLRMVPTAQSVVLATAEGASPGAVVVRKWVKDWWETHAVEPVSVSVLVKSGVVSETTFHRSKIALLNEGVIVREGEKSATRYRLTGNPTGSHSRTPTPTGCGSGRESSDPLPRDSHGSVGATMDVDTVEPGAVDKKPALTCARWLGAEDRHCGRTDGLRRYQVGPLCPEHAPGSR
jgi:hypothetical protein